MPTRVKKLCFVIVRQNDSVKDEIEGSSQANEHERLASLLHSAHVHAHHAVILSGKNKHGQPADYALVSCDCKVTQKVLETLRIVQVGVDEINTQDIFVYGHGLESGD